VEAAERSDAVDAKNFDAEPYDPGRDRRGVREVLASNGWEERHVAGQLLALDALAGGPGTPGGAFVVRSGRRQLGFATVEFREWNRLGQLHGLAVDPNSKRTGVATALVRRAEGFVRDRGGRVVYVDTPVTNTTARAFYEALGYRLAYTMPEYYDEGLDGVTYLKLFSDG
jgi:ribosomal protein S18 acetylase RimI-like enzyme